MILNDELKELFQDNAALDTENKQLREDNKILKDQVEFQEELLIELEHESQAQARRMKGLTDKIKVLYEIIEEQAWEKIKEIKESKA